VPIEIYEECGIQRNVLSLHACTGVQQAIGPNYPRTRVAQDRELAVHNALPDFQCVLAVVNANSDQTCVEGFEISCVPRELAQLARAVRSPVSPIEDQEHAFAAHRRQADGLTVFVLEDEVRRRLARRRRDLRPGQVLAGGPC
jgi:hypothetical protein